MHFRRRPAIHCTPGPGPRHLPRSVYVQRQHVHQRGSWDRPAPGQPPSRLWCLVLWTRLQGKSCRLPSAVPPSPPFSYRLRTVFVPDRDCLFRDGRSTRSPRRSSSSRTASCSARMSSTSGTRPARSSSKKASFATTTRNGWTTASPRTARCALSQGLRSGHRASRLHLPRPPLPSLALPCLPRPPLPFLALPCPPLPSLALPRPPSCSQRGSHGVNTVHFLGEAAQFRWRQLFRFPQGDHQEPGTRVLLLHVRYRAENLT